MTDYAAHAFLIFGENDSSPSGCNSGVGSAPAVGPADWRSLEVVMSVLVSVSEVLRRDATQAREHNPAPASMMLLLKILQYVMSPIRASSSATGRQALGEVYGHLPTAFLLTCCRLLGAVTFLLTPPSVGQCSVAAPSQISPFILSPFQELFSNAIEFVFYCLSQTSSRGGVGRSAVAHSAAEALLRLSTHGIHNIVNQSDATTPMTSIMRGIINSTAELLAPAPNSAARPVPLKSMLLVLQSVTVIISASPSHAHRADLLSALVNPVVVQLEINLVASAWSATEFIRSLQLVSHIIRYVSPWSASGEAFSAEDMGYIISFLGVVWPLLDQIASLVSTSEASIGNPVLDAVFAIYKNAVTNMPSLLAAQQGILAEMAQRAITSFFSLRNAEAIDCAAGMVEAFPTTARSLPEEAETFGLLEQMLQHAVQGMEMGCEGFLEAVLRELMAATTATGGGAAASSSGDGSVVRGGIGQSLARVKDRVREEWWFGDEPEVMEHYFNFIYQYFLCSPHIILHLAGENSRQSFSLVDNLMQLLLVSLHMFNERDTIRKILSILQAVFIPVVGGDALDAQQHNALVMLPSLRYSEVLLQLLFHLLDPAPEGGSHGEEGEVEGERESGSYSQSSGGVVSSSFVGGNACAAGASLGGQQALQTGLLPSLSETFYSLLVVCDENNVPGVVEWLTAKLVCQQGAGEGSPSLFLPSIATHAPERPVICSALLQFAHARTSRRFKTLLTDVHKVCNGEMDVAGLRDYCV